MKILFLTSRFPYPLEKGDKLRAYELIRHLSKYHRICLVAVNPQQPVVEQLAKLRPYCPEIYVHVINSFQSGLNLLRNVISKRPFSVAYFYNRIVERKIQAIIEQEQPDIVFCHLIRMSEYVRHLHSVPKILDYMDAFSAGMQRMQEKSGWVLNMFSSAEHKRLLNYERSVFDDFDERLIISDQDRNLIDHQNKKAIHVVPNGVDFDFFKAKKAEKKYDLLFPGNMNYPPNIQSVAFIINKVLPLIRRQKPDVTFAVAGANPSKEILKLNLDNVEVTGWVEDIREYFYQSKVMLAPMLISIGLQNKILQAMAMKTPCIITTLANNAIGARHESEVLIADTPETIAQSVLRLLNNEPYRNAMAERAYEFVCRHYNWNDITNDLNDLITRMHERG